MTTVMTTRRQDARRIREAAAVHAHDRNHPPHIANGDERAEWNYAFSFTKGLRHDPTTGLLKQPSDFEQFVRGIDSGDPRDFSDTPRGHSDGEPWRTVPQETRWRAWESQSAGLTFDLQGPDAQAVTMPPAPTVGSDELVGELAEVYAQALLRDLPFDALHFGTTAGCGDVDRVIDDLNRLDWFNPASLGKPGTGNGGLRRDLNRQSAFRGLAPGDTVGPYLSQFLLLGTPGLGGQRNMTDGIVQYGGQSIDQRVQIAQQADFMTTWDEWLDVQNGADLRGDEKYESGTRFITTGRDLATYVHYDALYQAYLNACLIMLNLGVPFDPGIPFQADDQVDGQQGFAQFGGPHILSLVTEVATRALKAVRFQKFNVHRRPRPEALAARLEKATHLDLRSLNDARQALSAGIGRRVQRKNKAATGQGSLLLPMAFPEGSPMHPSYGAGHATVAGACVTVLKAFFDHSRCFDGGLGSSRGWLPTRDGQGLVSAEVYNAHGERADLTIEGELNKLAANISIGRNWAGVHYFSDYWESLKMGEEIAIGILEEQKLTFRENFSMTIPLFEGGAIRI